AAGEGAARVGGVARVLHRLGEQRERARRRLELVTRVRDEVPPDLFNPAALGLVLDQKQYQPAVADARAQRGDAHGEARGPAAVTVGRELHLAFPDLAVPADLAGPGQQVLYADVLVHAQA